MKSKTLLLAALVGVAAASAQAGVSWNISIGLPLPVFYSQPVVCAPPPVVCTPPPVVCAPPPVVYTAPCPPPVVYSPPVYVQSYPACPSPDIIWLNGGWCNHPAHYTAGYGHPEYHSNWYQHRDEHFERDHYQSGRNHY